jgi:hypothetical protein
MGGEVQHGRDDGRPDDGDQDGRHPLEARGSTSRTASVVRPTATVAPSDSSRLVKNARSSSRKPSASVEKPNSLGSWPTMIVMPRPFMYPTCTSTESRSTTNPSLATPSPISMTPTISASMPASMIAVDGSSPATSRGASAAKMSGDTDESGPRTRMRDGPMTAYPTRHAMVV